MFDIKIILPSDEGGNGFSAKACLVVLGVLAVSISFFLFSIFFSIACLASGVADPSAFLDMLFALLGSV